MNNRFNNPKSVGPDLRSRLGSDKWDMSEGIVLYNGWLHLSVESGHDMCVHSNFCPSHVEVNQLVDQIRKSTSPLEKYTYIDVKTTADAVTCHAAVVPQLIPNQAYITYNEEMDSVNGFGNAWPLWLASNYVPDEFSALSGVAK